MPHTCHRFKGGGPAHRGEGNEMGRKGGGGIESKLILLGGHLHVL